MRLITSGLLFSSLTLNVAAGVVPLGVQPVYPYDPNTTKYCSWWWDHDGGTTCDAKLNTLGIAREDFFRWNPVLQGSCTNVVLGRSYCVETKDEPAPTGITSTIPTTPPPTPTATGTPKPSPTQEGLIESCVHFYKAVSGDTCDKLVKQFGVFTLSEFQSWNPAVGADCTGLWVDYYYCVGIPGTPTAKPTSVPPSTTTSPSGPSPTQDGIISTCNRFYKAASGDTCSTIVAKYGTFTLDSFIAWNPAVNKDCSGLWLDYYYCVGIPGTPTQQPTPTTTNGPVGPSPTQDGIIKTCQRYHKAVAGDTCAKISEKYGTFTVESFIKWNPAVKADCSGLWAGYYYCIGIPGTPTQPTSKPPPTPTGCPGAPSPTQPGAVCPCKKWHKVASGENCDTIQKKYKITAANFHKWNPKVGSNCQTLWLGYHVCVSA